MNEKRLQQVKADAETKLAMVLKQEASAEAGVRACAAEQQALDAELAKLDPGDDRAFDTFGARQRTLAEQGELRKKRLAMAIEAVGKVRAETAATIAKAMQAEVGTLEAEFKAAEAATRETVESAARNIATSIDASRAIAIRMSDLSNQVQRTLGLPLGGNLPDADFAHLPTNNHEQLLVAAGQMLARAKWRDP